MKRRLGVLCYGLGRRLTATGLRLAPLPFDPNEFPPKILLRIDAKRAAAAVQRRQPPPPFAL